MPATIVINAAGCGSRLGKGIPKSLVHVGARRILHWQLSEMCHFGDDVKIVVGFQGDEVAAFARNLFPRIQVLYNADWRTTKTAASLTIGAATADGRCLSLDGDLLVHPWDFRLLVNSVSDVIGITPVNSSQPVYAQLDNSGRCTSFSFGEITPWEWTGLVNFDRRRVPGCNGNVFEMIQCLLPAPVMRVRTVEVDTLDDLRQAPAIWSSMLKDCIQSGELYGPAENSRLLAG